MAGATPWSLLRAHARAAAPAVAICVLILVAVEAGIFRSGVFRSQLRVSSPDFPAAKLALAARTTDARVLYVGDSTVLTGVAPAEVTAACACGPGFNGAFAASTPLLTRAMTRRLLEHERPSVVVLGVAPWDMESGARFTDTELAHELLTPSELASAGAPLDPATWIDAAFARISSVYGERLLIKEWLASLLPGARYDESQRGYYAVRGTATSPSQLSAEVARMRTVHPGEPSASAPGALVIGALVSELRERGVATVFLLPPIHPAAYEQNGPSLARGEAVVRELAASAGVPLVDCRTAVARDDFRDLLHLGPSGAIAHSRCVGAALRSLGTR